MFDFDEMTNHQRNDMIVNLSQRWAIPLLGFAQYENTRILLNNAGFQDHVKDRTVHKFLMVCHHHSLHIPPGFVHSLILDPHSTLVIMFCWE